MGWPRVGIVCRGDAEAERQGIASNERLRPIVDALTARGADVEPTVYRDGIADQVEQRLRGCDAVLAWVDPLGGGEDRVRFDRLLRDLADDGTFVSAHPDVIAAMGTKDVLFATRDLGWGCDIHRYASLDDLRRELPARLAVGPRVLKRQRGNAGIGVWKVELVDEGRVRVHHAQVRDTETEVVALSDFVDRVEPSFAGGAHVIDQEFQPRVAEGIIRAYLVGAEVVGFAHQGPGDLASTPERAANVMGLPSPKRMMPPAEPALGALRQLVETEWVPKAIDLVGVATDRLPLLWDVDLLLGAPAPDGADTYVLCEINMSCITPFPPEAVEKVAAALLALLQARA